MSNRQPGYYWVKFEDRNVWEIAEWMGDSWYAIGNDGRWEDEDFAQIDENQVAGKRDSVFPDAVEPNWITHHGYRNQEYETELDTNSAPRSDKALRHRKRAYTGETIQPWTYGPPPSEPPA